MPHPDKPAHEIENLSGEGARQDEQDLVEDLRPGPDKPVIRKAEKRQDIERGWVIAVFLAMLILINVIDLAGSALLSARAWAQMKPEVSDVRAFWFQVTGVIIGYYFGTAMRRRDRS